MEKYKPLFDEMVIRLQCLVTALSYFSSHPCLSKTCFVLLNVFCSKTTGKIIHITKMQINYK